MDRRALLLEAMTFHETHHALRTAAKWIDGDMACLAGRICLIAGATPIQSGLRGDTGRGVSYGGWHRHVPDLAVELTGITMCEGRWLFHWQRTLTEIRGAVEAIDDGRTIPGRPYWVFPDTDHRFITRDGRIVVACHRRVVFQHTGAGWSTVIMPDEHRAWNYARATARELAAIPYRLTPHHDHRSITL